MTRCIAFTLHFSSTKRFASHPEAPDASAKRRFGQNRSESRQAAAEMMLPDRFTITRAVSGFSPSAIHFASVMRLPRVGTFCNGQAPGRLVWNGRLSR